MDEKTAPARGSASSDGFKVCHLKSCRAEFKPRRHDQKFCSPACKGRHSELVYETGRKIVEGRGIHHRHLSNPHLQRILACLSDGRAWTTRELHKATNLENVSTAICELRKAGVNISRAKLVRITETGAKVYEYRLIGG